MIRAQAHRGEDFEDGGGEDDPVGDFVGEDSRGERRRGHQRRRDGGRQSKTSRGGVAGVSQAVIHHGVTHGGD